MSTTPEVNVITIQTPQGPKQRVTVESDHQLLFTGEIPREAVTAVVKALLSATSDAARDGEPLEPFSEPFVDEQCVPPDAYLIVPTDHPNYFRLAFAFGAAELHIALKRRYLRMFASKFMRLADELGVEPDPDDIDAVTTDEPGEEDGTIRVTTGVPPDGKQFALLVHEGDKLLADMTLPARAITPLAARILDVAVSCARRNPPASRPLEEDFDDDLCVHPTAFAVAKTKLPHQFGFSFEFGATPLHVAMNQKDLRLIGTNLLALATELGIKSEGQSPPPRPASGWLGRLLQRGSS